MVEVWSLLVGPSSPLQTCYTLQVYSNDGHWLTVSAHADLAVIQLMLSGKDNDRARFV